MRVSLLKMRLYYAEGEAEGDTAAAEAAAAAAAAAEKKFTQKDVDAIINKRLGSLKTEREKTLADFKKLQESSSLTVQEKEELAGKITTLEEMIQTKEERSKNEINKFKTKYDTDVNALRSEAGQWKGLFEDSTIKRNLMDAAIAENAESPEQIIMMFRGATRLEEVKDDQGKPTGSFVTMMKFQGIDPETKKAATLDMTPAEAIKHMRDNKLHANLFKHGANAGTGGSAGGAGGKDSSAMPDPKDYASSDDYQKAYMGWREKYNFDGSLKKKD